MTREEARTILATWLVSAKGTKEQRGYIEGWFDKSDEEAFEKAIEALKAEPKILETIDFAIDASNGGTNYYVGFRNGLRYAKSLVDGAEPQFENCAEQEPKHGKWIFNPKDAIESMFTKPKCSECGFESSDGGNFCPNCGAKMDKE